ncbi:uncharacterized protein B0T15DRAFT_570439 [Chaetomium strumarium]|uniref:Uncharacterized protein n=1 Tax=Chaetomium strumarium TaxID=1170767 RepID=A0AAJ0H1B3_9PEZI|nr:hypothetical protein B0T15DRAFT_570439 [Chaetomium strumarium]
MYPASSVGSREDTFHDGSNVSPRVSRPTNPQRTEEARFPSPVQTRASSPAPEEHESPAGASTQGLSVKDALQRLVLNNCRITIIINQHAHTSPSGLDSDAFIETPHLLPRVPSPPLARNPTPGVSVPSHHDDFDSASLFCDDSSVDGDRDIDPGVDGGFAYMRQGRYGLEVDLPRGQGFWDRWDGRYRTEPVVRCPTPFGGVDVNPGEEGPQSDMWGGADVSTTVANDGYEDSDPTPERRATAGDQVDT